MNGVTEKTEGYVKNWIATRQYRDRILSQLEQSKKEASFATNELGKWLLPNDAKKDEEFNIWYGSGILQAKLVNPQEGIYEVKWRKEPDGKDRYEKGF